MRCHISFMLVLCAVTGLLFAATASGQTALNPAGRVAACPANPPVAGVDGWHVKIYTSVSNRDNQLVHAAHGLEGHRAPQVPWPARPLLNRTSTSPTRPSAPGMSPANGRYPA